MNPENYEETFIHVGDWKPACNRYILLGEGQINSKICFLNIGYEVSCEYLNLILIHPGIFHHYVITKWPKFVLASPSLLFALNNWMPPSIRGNTYF